MGIVGLGSIGAEIAKRARGFDMRVQYHNRHRRGDLPYVYTESVTELASLSDYLMISCPGNTETRGMIDGEVLAALGAGGILINIARGSIVDTVDGTEDQRAQLCRLENVVLTPHTAGNTDEAVRAKNQLMQDILAAHFTGRPVKNRLA